MSEADRLHETIQRAWQEEVDDKCGGDQGVLSALERGQVALVQSFARLEARLDELEGR